MTREEFEANLAPKLRNNPAYEVSPCACDWPTCGGWHVHPAGQPDAEKNTPEWDQMAEDSGWNDANPGLASIIRLLYPHE